MLLVTVLTVGQEQPWLVQHCWAVMGKMGPQWACTGPFGLLGPLLSLRLGAGQARPWVSLWKRRTGRGDLEETQGRLSKGTDHKPPLRSSALAPNWGQVGPWRVSLLSRPLHCGPAPEMSHLAGMAFDTCFVTSQPSSRWLFKPLSH